jgi:hypothetical protein
LYIDTYNKIEGIRKTLEDSDNYLLKVFTKKMINTINKFMIQKKGKSNCKSNMIVFLKIVKYLKERLFNEKKPKN